MRLGDRLWRARGNAAAAGLPHAPGRQVEKPHAGEGSEHALGALLVAPHDPPVLPDLGKRWLVRSYFDPMAVLLLLAGLAHAEEKVRLIVLQSDGVAAGRIARVDDRLTVPPQLFTDDLERSCLVAVDADRDRVEQRRLIRLLEFHLEGTARLAEPNDLGSCTAYRFPLDLTSGTVLAADDVRQPITAPDAVQEAEGIPDVALAACIGPDEHREGAHAKRLVDEVLEVHQAERTEASLRAEPGGRPRRSAACVRLAVRRP